MAVRGEEKKWTEASRPSSPHGDGALDGDLWSLFPDLRRRSEFTMFTLYLTTATFDSVEL